MRYLSTEELRKLDQKAVDEYGIPSAILMENAGRGAAEILLRELAPSDRVLIFCGPGNNGGDGGVMARHLDLSGISVTLVWMSEPDRLSPDARLQYNILSHTDVHQHIWSETFNEDSIGALLEPSTFLVDGMFGTGLTRPVEGRFRVIIEAMNAARRPIVALDVPSGLDANTGLPLGVAIRARKTITFVASKEGFAHPESRKYTGEVEVAHIGVPAALLREFGLIPA